MSNVNVIRPSPSMGNLDIANDHPIAQPGGEAAPGGPGGPGGPGAPGGPSRPVDSEHGLAPDRTGIGSDSRSTRAAGPRARDATALAPGQEQKTYSKLWRSFVSLLAGMPRIGSSQTVKAWVADIKLADDFAAERFDSLVNGLEKRFGPEAKDRAMAITHIDKNVPLTARTIKAAHEAAKAHQLRGAARDYANHTQLEVWTRQGTKRLGHVGLSVSHAIQPDRTMATDKTWAKAEDRTYMSWFPTGQETPPRRLESPGAKAAHKVTEVAKKVISMETPLVVPIVSKSYNEDMVYETSERTKERLVAGSMQPRPNQELVEVEDENGEDGEMTKIWGTHADSRLAVPMMGDNHSRKTDQSQFAYFGLNERDMLEGWNVLTDPDNMDNLIFDTVSTGENCAGRATQLLRLAGAEVFLPLPASTFLQDPNQMERYGQQLMTIVSELNAKAAKVDEAFRPPPAVVREENGDASPEKLAWRASMLAAEEKVSELETFLPFDRPADIAAAGGAPSFMPGEAQKYSENYVIPASTGTVTSQDSKRYGTTRALGIARQIDMIEKTNPLFFAELKPLREALRIVGASDAQDFKTLTNQCKILVDVLHDYAIRPINAQAMPWLTAAHASLATLQAACNSVCRMDVKPIDGVLKPPAEVEVAEIAEVTVEAPKLNKRQRAALQRQQREAATAAEANQAALQARLANQSV